MLLVTHPAMLAHEPPQGHPERSARLAAVLQALEGMALQRVEAPPAPRAALARVHDAAYLDWLDTQFPEVGVAALDADTYLSPGSREAASRAAGGVLAAVDAVLAGRDDMAFCAVRPPGHHAEPNSAMGFCIYNNIAIGALHARAAHGLDRVAVVDFDVHHGNGTQTIAEREPALFFASTHQSPFYPGTGAAQERGPAGNIVNAPLPAGTDGSAWRRAMTALVLPALAAFGPELILVSAGFDAHRDDPLAQLALDATDFAWAGAALREVAQSSARGRVVSTLEGGYDLAALGRSAAAFIGGLGVR
ncbi:MAG: histone deacetylase family protein [Hyphomonadaceae bacterium]